MKKKMIQISQPSTGEDEWLSMKDSILSGWLTQGPKVAEFEKKFAEFHNSKHALATTSCTTGLHLILASMNLGPGDDVLVPAFTWVSTANVVLHVGANPIFVDVDTDTYNIDPNKIVEKITPNTKAIIVVHLFGLCVDVEDIKSKIPSNIKIIEDCACASGAIINGRYAGSLGDAGSFSFHPRKTITTGEGGMVTTQDDNLANIANILRNHGASISEEQRHLGMKPYNLPEFNMLGFNYRMTDIQGSIGLAQLSKLDSLINERDYWANYYIDQLKDIAWLNMPKTPKNGRHAWQAFVVYVKPDQSPFSRNQIMEKLQENSISTRPGTHAVHMLNYYRTRFNIRPDNFPGAKNCDQNTMAIPLHSHLKKNDYEYIVDSIRNIK